MSLNLFYRQMEHSVEYNYFQYSINILQDELFPIDTIYSVFTQGPKYIVHCTYMYNMSYNDVFTVCRANSFKRSISHVDLTNDVQFSTNHW